MDDSEPVLILIDVQRAFDDEAYWGRRDNPDCEANIGRLAALWTERGLPVVMVRHDSTESRSPLRRDSPGNAFKDVVADVPHEVLVTKSVNSAFLGEPDLDAWLRARDLRTVVICGMTTNHCCETTARMAGNLGYETLFVAEATHAFDRAGPDGVVLPAELLAKATCASLHGEFAQVVTVDDVQALLDARPAAVAG